MLPTQQQSQVNLKLAGESPAWLERARQLQAERLRLQEEAEQERIEKVREDFREWQGERTLELFALLDLLGIPADREVDAAPGEAKVIAHSDQHDWVDGHRSDWRKPYAIIANLKIVAPDRTIWDIDPPKDTRSPFGPPDKSEEQKYEAKLKEWREERKLVTASFVMDYAPSDPEAWQAIYDYRADGYHYAHGTEEESPYTHQRINSPGGRGSEMLRGDDLLVAFADAIDAITAKVATMTAEYEAHLAEEGQAEIVEGDTIPDPTPEQIEAENARIEAQHNALQQAIYAISEDMGDCDNLRLALIDDESGEEQGVEMPLAVTYILDALELAGYELREMSDDQ